MYICILKDYFRSLLYKVVKMRPKNVISIKYDSAENDLDEFLANFVSMFCLIHAE